jgi:hypothetical protein
MLAAKKIQPDEWLDFIYGGVWLTNRFVDSQD